MTWGTRRDFCCTAALLAWSGLQPRSGLYSAALAAEGTVYVFAITDLRPHALQKMFEVAMPGLSVMAFGRVGDFSRALEATPPDGALAPAPVLESLGQNPVVQGTHGASPVEEYSILSEQPISLSQLGDKTIGCLDLLGRKKLPGFVASVLGLNVEPNLQRVTKVEDLLQLLQFRRADAILLPKRFVADMQAQSKMEFAVLAVPGAFVKRTAIAFPGNRGAVETAIKALPPGLNYQLGVDGWS